MSVRLSGVKWCGFLTAIHASVKSSSHILSGYNLKYLASLSIE